MWLMQAEASFAIKSMIASKHINTEDEDKIGMIYGITGALK